MAARAYIVVKHKSNYFNPLYMSSINNRTVRCALYIHNLKFECTTVVYANEKQAMFNPLNRIRQNEIWCWFVFEPDIRSRIH